MYKKSKVSSKVGMHTYDFFPEWSLSYQVLHFYTKFNSCPYYIIMVSDMLFFSAYLSKKWKNPTKNIYVYIFIAYNYAIPPKKKQWKSYELNRSSARNKHTELMSKFRHRAKFLLSSILYFVIILSANVKYAKCTHNKSDIYFRYLIQTLALKSVITRNI